MSIAITVRGLELKGAYGVETSMANWHAGKDFRVTGGNGAYASIRDVEAIKADGFDLIEFRKHNGTHVHTLVLNEALKDLIKETDTGQRILNEG